MHWNNLLHDLSAFNVMFIHLLKDTLFILTMEAGASAQWLSVAFMSTVGGFFTFSRISSLIYLCDGANATSHAITVIGIVPQKGKFAEST